MAAHVGEEARERLESLLSELKIAVEKNEELLESFNSSDGNHLEALLSHAQSAHRELQKRLEDSEKALESDLRSYTTQTDKPPRLSPEEQDVAYERKAQHMRLLDSRNAKLKEELLLSRKVRGGPSPRPATSAYDTTLSKASLNKLVKKQDRQAKEAGKKIQELQFELERTQRVAVKYKNLYESQLGQNNAEVKDQNGNEEKQENIDPLYFEVEEEDEESVLKAYNKRLATHRKQKSSSPLKLFDILRKNEVLILENDSLKREITRLKRDNANLLKDAKKSRSDRDEALHHYATSEAARKELMKRYEKQISQHRRLDKSLTRQANEWIQTKKTIQQLEGDLRLTQVGSFGVLDGEKRLYAHSVRKNVDSPRKTLSPEHWAMANQTLQ